MTYTVRRTFFYILTALFFIIGTGAVLYAQGWRFDPKEFEIGKVGAIYIKAAPKNSEISLEEIETKTPGFFGEGVLFDDLFPKPYRVFVRSPGYYTWQMSLPVKPSRITYAPNVVLVPRISERVHEGPVSDLFLAGTVPGFQTEDGLVIGETIMPGYEHVISTPDGNIILVRNTESGAYVWEDKRDNERIPLNKTFVNAGISQRLIRNASFLLPPHGEFLTINTTQKLYLLHPESEKIITLSSDPVLSADISSQNIVWATYDEKKDASLLHTYDFSEDETLEIGSLPGKTKDMKMLSGGNIAVLQHDGKIFLFEKKNGFQPLALGEGVNRFFPDPGKTRIAITGKDLQIIPLLKEQEQITIVVPQVTQIKNIVWYRDGMHLFLEYPENVMFLGITDLNLDNFLAVAGSQGWAYEPDSSRLYAVEQDGSLTYKEFPF